MCFRFGQCLVHERLLYSCWLFDWFVFGLSVSAGVVLVCFLGVCVLYL